MTKQYAVYILASGYNGTLYVGVTGNLINRIWQHRNGACDGFTRKYSIKSLVWYELHSDVLQAIKREKQLKQWKRAWKIRLIEQQNTEWRDLWGEITGF